MAKLGDAFSDDQRRESVRRQLQPGAVIYIEVVFPEGRKPKYLVIAHVDHECTTFVVNSRVNPFIEEGLPLRFARSVSMRPDTPSSGETRTSPATRFCGYRP